MNSLIEDLEALINEIEKTNYIKYVGILGLNGNAIISRLPPEILDMVQSLLLYLGVIDIYSLTAQIRDLNIGISRFQDHILILIDQGDVDYLQKVLDSSAKKFKKCLEKEIAKERKPRIKVYSGPLKTPPKNQIPVFEPLVEMPQQTEMTVFSIPVKKIFTLEFLNNKMSEDLTYKYGEWVVDLLLMIDGEKNIGQLTKALKRDISEVIMVLEELIKNRAVAIKRLKLNNI
ncbi:MAG: hypothetical protein ACUVXA_05790 [Candidatus Jordarchaeum sp.]|uniref:hypothetical protein n=1 Tax=Candidatus Jordarchaeum sp. TaxID=2823881 RepID=UPI00404A81B3